MTPTVSRDGPGLLVSGLVGSPYGIGPGAARVLLLGRQFAHLLAADEAGNGIPGGLAYVTEGDMVRFRPGLCLDHGVYEAPLLPIWRLFAGLEVHPVELREVTA